jgi:mitochondrial fission protein ELM1
MMADRSPAMPTLGLGAAAHSGAADALVQRPHPTVWLILSDKAGDNAQVMAIAEALPWPVEIRSILVHPRYVLGKPKVGPSLDHVDAAKSDPLLPPWPDLVITIGRRMSSVALWIKAQSGGRTKIALLGAPKGQLGDFDLAVISEQYRASKRGNTMRIHYPLQRIDRASIAAEAAIWRADFAALPRPIIAAMIGGLTKEVKFDVGIAAQLGRDLGQLVRQERGSLVVATSRRTPPDVVATLKTTLPADAQIYEWQPSGGRNPYRALLGMADRFVVTCDSLSMQMEIAQLGRPLAVYRLPPGSFLSGGPLSAFADGILGSRRFGSGMLRHWEQQIGTALDWLGSLRHHRDLFAVPRRLIAEGHAVWFGQPFRLGAPVPPDELPAVVARLRALVE